MRPELRRKLEAMAAAEESPHEAAIARAKLEALGSGSRVPPRRPPAAPAGPAPDPFAWSSWTTTSSGTTLTGSFVRIEVKP